MSYILDALRKSEQERQIASGHGTGLLFPAATEQRPGISRRTIILGAMVLIVTIGLNGWLWSRTSPPAKAVPAGISATPQPAPNALPALPAQAPTAQTPPQRLAGERQAAQVASPPAERKPAVIEAAVTEKPTRRASAEQPSQAASASAKNETSTEPQKGLPSISISGYIKDDTGGNLAIINDKLVREGEEVSPGLRLEKIDGEHAFFNFRGQRFRR